MKKFLVLTVALLMIMGIVGCSNVSDKIQYSSDNDESYEAIKDQVSFMTADGSEISLDLLEDNSIVISTIKPADAEESENEMDLNYEDLITAYKIATGKTDVPEKIIQFDSIIKNNILKNKEKNEQNNIELSKPENDVLDEQTRYTSYGNAPVKMSLSEEQFIKKYGSKGNNFDYHVCWTRRTNNAKVQGWLFSMHTYAYVYRGSVTHKIKRKKAGSWSTIRSYTVNAGYLSKLDYYAGGLNDYIKGEIWNGEGDGWHMTIYGID